MVPGSIIKKRIRAKNLQTGLPADAALVADFDLRLFSTSDGVPVKTYKVGEGIEKQSDGNFIITITAADSLLLKGKTGSAILNGFVLPMSKSIRINLGAIKQNKANG